MKKNYHCDERCYDCENYDCPSHPGLEDADDFDYYESDRGLYSPSMPWNAPGMSVSDFI